MCQFMRTALLQKLFTPESLKSSPVSVGFKIDVHRTMPRTYNRYSANICIFIHVIVVERDENTCVIAIQNLASQHFRTRVISATCSLSTRVTYSNVRIHSQRKIAVAGCYVSLPNRWHLNVSYNRLAAERRRNDSRKIHRSFYLARNNESFHSGCLNPRNRSNTLRFIFYCF